MSVVLLCLSSFVISGTSDGVVRRPGLPATACAVDCPIPDRIANHPLAYHALRPQCPRFEHAFQQFIVESVRCSEASTFRALRLERDPRPTAGEARRAGPDANCDDIAGIGPINHAIGTRAYANAKSGHLVRCLMQRTI